MSSSISQTVWHVLSNATSGNTTDTSSPTATAEISWLAISTAGFLAFSTLIGSDAFENYCASGPILWTAGSLYLSPVGSIGVFKSGMKMLCGTERSKRLGWEPQDVLLNKEKLYSFTRHETPRYVVNKAETHHRRLYTWRPRSTTDEPGTRPSNGQSDSRTKIWAIISNGGAGANQANGQASGSIAGQRLPTNREQTSKNKQIYKLSGGHRVRTRTKEREDDIWMMGGRCLAVNNVTFMAHNRALRWNAIASIVIVIVLAALPAIYEILRLRSDVGDGSSWVGIAWAVSGPMLHISLTVISYLRLSLRNLPRTAGRDSDEWLGVSLAEQKKWRYFRTSMNVYGIQGGALQKRPQDYSFWSRLVGSFLIFYSILSIVYQAIISTRITNEELSHWRRGAMCGYLAMGLMARFLVFAIYFRIQERNPNCKVIDHPHHAAEIIYRCTHNEETLEAKQAVVRQLALWLAATSIYDIGQDKDKTKTTIRFRLAHAQGERWNISQSSEDDMSEPGENLATLTTNESGDFDLTLPRCGYTDSAVSHILLGRNRASVFMFAGRGKGGPTGQLFVCDVPEKLKESSEAQQNRSFRCFFGVFPRTEGNSGECSQHKSLVKV